MLCHSPGLLSARQQLLRPGAALMPGFRTRTPCLVVRAAKGFGNTKRSTRVWHQHLHQWQQQQQQDTNMSHGHADMLCGWFPTCYNFCM
jgi:hypothetical protein